MQAKESLLAAAAKARKEKPAETEAEKMLREEQEIMRNITSRKALKSVMENAQVRSGPPACHPTQILTSVSLLQPFFVAEGCGNHLFQTACATEAPVYGGRMCLYREQLLGACCVVSGAATVCSVIHCQRLFGADLSCLLQGISYTRNLKTGWKPPLKVRQLSEDQAQDLRDRFHIIVEGENLLPPILDFKDMKFPAPVLRQLASKNISRPTPIQMQVCCQALQGSLSPLVAVCNLPSQMVYLIAAILCSLLLIPATYKHSACNECFHRVSGLLIS